MSELDKNKTAARQEVPFRVSLRGIFDAYTRITHDFPVSVFEKAATRVDSATKHMMTGRAAAVTMPLGIIIRNGARVAHGAVNKNGYGFGAGVAGVVGAGGSWWLLGNTAYNALTTSALTGTAGSIGAVIAAAVVTSPILSPAFTAGRLIGATLLGTAASVISVLGAAINLKVAALRSADAMRGVQYDEDTLKLMREPYEKGALSAIDEQRRLQDAWNKVGYLTKENRVKIYEDLHREFGEKEETEVPQKVRGNRAPQP